MKHTFRNAFFITLAVWAAAVPIGMFCISAWVRPSAEAVLQDWQKPYECTTQVKRLSPLYLTLLKWNPPMPISDAERTVTDEMVTDALQNLLEQHARWETAVGRTKAQSGDFVLADYIVSAQGQVLSVHNDIRMEIGGNFYDPAFTNQFIGVSVGQTFVFPYESDERGSLETYEIEATLLDIQEQQLPELTDSFVSDAFGVASVDALRAQLLQQLQAQKEAEAQQRFVLDLFQRTLSNCADYTIHTGELNDAARKRYDAALALYEPFLSPLDKARLYFDCQTEVRDQIELRLAVDAIVERESLYPTAAEIEAAGGEFEARYEKAAAFLLSKFDSGA